MTAAMEKERTDFESAYGDANLSRHLHYPDCYADSHVQAAWNGWKAGRASISPQVPVEAIEVALVYLDDALRDSDLSAGAATGSDLQMWRTNSAALMKHIESLRALLPGGEK